MNLKVGSHYNWKNQPERLIYKGELNGWHQFAKVDTPDEVWSEVLDSELMMMEETNLSVDEWEEVFILDNI